MIDRKYQKHVLLFFNAFFMTCVVSFAISVLHLGFVNTIIIVWLKAWAFAFAIALTTIIIISPLVNKLVEWVLKDE